MIDTWGETDTLIVGAGFAGLSVACRLDAASTLVVDRGEPLDVSEARRRLIQEPWCRAEGDLSNEVDAETRVMRSSRPSEQVQLPLSLMSANVYSYRQGGISNWWGGYSPRLSTDCFAADGVIAWPIGLPELDIYYQAAERALRVHGDPTRIDCTVLGAMPGWDLWRNYLRPYFPQAHVTSEAKNLTDHASRRQGLCTGNGHCAICGNDAKARPSNVFPDVSVFNRTMVREILFEGSRATAAFCETDGEVFGIRFRRIVLAAGGLENVALLRRSRLPSTVRIERIGQYYQDHSAAELLVRMPDPVPYFQVGAECHVELPELSGMINGLEVKTLLLTIPPDDKHFGMMIKGSSPRELVNFTSTIPRIARLYLQMEIPPEWELRLRTRGNDAFIYSMPYLYNIPILDSIVMEVMRRAIEKGLRIEGILPHHRYAFGGHHYSGTTPMSRSGQAVVTDEHCLIGSDNVYINGASVIPRCGGAGPTLTVVALGFRLGDILAGKGASASSTWPV